MSEDWDQGRDQSGKPSGHRRVSGAVEPETEWQPIYGEYRVGSFYREFALSDQIDVNGIKASMKEGVLDLHLPKAEKHRPRSIEVKAG